MSSGSFKGAQYCASQVHFRTANGQQRTDYVGRRPNYLPNAGRHALLRLWQIPITSKS
jgi:hypothetical protein